MAYEEDHAQVDLWFLEQIMSEELSEEHAFNLLWLASKFTKHLEICKRVLLVKTLQSNNQQHSMFAKITSTFASLEKVKSLGG